MKTRNLLLSLVLGSCACLGASQCTTIPIDQSQAAPKANDNTIVLQGPGGESFRGYLFVQKNEGTLPSEVISLIVPKLDCKRDSCVRFQFFRRDGSAGYSGGILKGNTKFDFRLSDLVGHPDAATLADDGEYRAVVQVYYQGADNTEYSAVMNGFVRLNVLSKDYQPVGCNDPAIGWVTTIRDNCEAQWTSSARSAICGKNCR